MANVVPLSGATSAGGGALIRTEFIDALQTAVLRKSGFLQLSSVTRTNTRKVTYSVYAGRPTVSFVGEGAAKPVTGAELTTLDVNIKKIATIVPFTDEMIEDAMQDPENFTGPDVQAAIADTIDAHGIGVANGTAIGSPGFGAGNTLISTTQTVEYDQTKPDALALAVSEAIGILEGNGVTPDGVLAGYDIRRGVRDAQNADNLRLYAAGGNGGFDPFYGLRTAFTSNLVSTGAAAAGKVMAIVGDFTGGTIVKMRKDMDITRSSEASLDLGGGTTLNLYQQDAQAVRYVTRLGFTPFEVSKRFVKILNAA